MIQYFGILLNVMRCNIRRKGKAQFRCNLLDTQFSFNIGNRQIDRRKMLPQKHEIITNYSLAKNNGHKLRLALYRFSPECNRMHKRTYLQRIIHTRRLFFSTISNLLNFSLERANFFPFAFLRVTGQLQSFTHFCRFPLSPLQLSIAGTLLFVRLAG